MRTRRTPLSRTGPSDSVAGFSLLELMVTMGLATLLIGVGAGVYVKMGRRTAAVQAIGAINQIVTRAKNASSKYPATIVADPAAGEIRAYTDEVLQELHFESRPTESGEYTPMGIDGRDAGALGSETDPTGGRVGGGLRMTGGSIDCGSFAAYDVSEGLNAELWICPTVAPKCDLVSKGRAFRARIESFGARSARIVVRVQVQDDAGVQDAVERSVDVPAVQLGKWLGIRVSYDRNEISTATSSGYGFVIRDAWKESRRIALDPDAPLLLAAGFQGWVDDVRIGGVRAADPLRLPDGVTLVGDNSPIRFVAGRLDPERHTGPARIAVSYAGQVSTFEIGQSGAVLAVHQTEAPLPVPVDAPEAVPQPSRE